MGVNSAVQWCCYVIVLALCGYGMYRQHCLEQRLSVLEEKHRGLRNVVIDMESVEAKVPKLKREKRDANDCICPPGKYLLAALQRNNFHYVPERFYF